MKLSEMSNCPTLSNELCFSQLLMDCTIGVSSDSLRNHSANKEHYAGDHVASETKVVDGRSYPKRILFLRTSACASVCRGLSKPLRSPSFGHAVFATAAKRTKMFRLLWNFNQCVRIQNPY